MCCPEEQKDGAFWGPPDMPAAGAPRFHPEGLCQPLVWGTLLETHAHLSCIRPPWVVCVWRGGVVCVCGGGCVCVLGGVVCVCACVCSYCLCSH